MAFRRDQENVNANVLLRPEPRKGHAGQTVSLLSGSFGSLRLGAPKDKKLLNAPSSSAAEAASWREIIDKAWSKPKETVAPSDTAPVSKPPRVATVDAAAASTKIFQDRVKAQVRLQIEERIEEQRRKILGIQPPSTKAATASNASLNSASSNAPLLLSSAPSVIASDDNEVSNSKNDGAANSPPAPAAPRAWTSAWWNKPGMSMLPGLDSPAAKIATAAATATAARTSELLAAGVEGRADARVRSKSEHCAQPKPGLSASANSLTAVSSAPAEAPRVMPATQVPLPVTVSKPQAQSHTTAPTCTTKPQLSATTVPLPRHTPVPMRNGQMHVVVRVRPLIEEDHRQEMLSKGIDDKDADQTLSSLHRARPCVSVDMHHSKSHDNAATTKLQCSVRISREFHDDRVFRFGNVLPPLATQEQTYATVARPVVDGVLQGINGTVLAYGQTGSGKTYTTFGNMTAWQGGNHDALLYNNAGVSSSAGIVPRAVRDIFDHAARVESNATGKAMKCRIYVSFLEVYMENLTDLLVLDQSKDDTDDFSVHTRTGKSKPKSSRSNSHNTNVGAHLSSYERKLLEARRRKKQLELESLQEQQRRMRERQQQNDWGRDTRRMALSADPGISRKHYDDSQDYSFGSSDNNSDQMGRLENKQLHAKKKRANAHSSSKRLAIREDSRSKRVFVENLSKTRVQSPEEVLKLISNGVGRRVTANYASSSSSRSLLSCPFTLSSGRERRCLWAK